MTRLLSREREATRASQEGRTDLSVITKEMRVAGDVETGGAIRVEGAVAGCLRARSLDLSADGSVAGDVTAVDAESDEHLFLVGGVVRGAVRAGHVEVGPRGTVLGGIVAEHATVRGRVEGGIVVRGRLALTDTAVVEGDVKAHRLALEEGGQVNGNIRVGDRSPPVEVAGGSEAAESEALVRA